MRSNKKSDTHLNIDREQHLWLLIFDERITRLWCSTGLKLCFLRIPNMLSNKAVTFLFKLKKKGLWCVLLCNKCLFTFNFLSRGILGKRNKDIVTWVTSGTLFHMHFFSWCCWGAEDGLATSAEKYHLKLRSDRKHVSLCSDPTIVQINLP